MSEDRLVYSTDPKLNNKCPKCRELVVNCRCPKDQTVKASNFVAKLRIEKQGRGGKSVTVIYDLPKVEIYLKEWTKKLKNKCGSGGTYRMDGKEGIIEIQGDKRDLIRDILSAEGIRVKG